jgi:uncharacterized small protein (DUF1192 family)
MTTFHLTFNNNKASEDRIKYLQDEVESLQKKILQIQATNKDESLSSSRCQEISDELKRVKRQLKEKTDSQTAPQCMDIKEIFHSTNFFYLIFR